MKIDYISFKGWNVSPISCKSHDITHNGNNSPCQVDEKLGPCRIEGTICDKEDASGYVVPMAEVNMW